MRDSELSLQIKFAKQRSHEVWTEAHVVFMILRSYSNNYNSIYWRERETERCFFDKQQDKTKLMCNVRQNNKFTVFQKSYNGVPNHLKEKKNLHSRPLQIFSLNVVFIALNKGLIYKLESTGDICNAMEQTNVLERRLHWRKSNMQELIK